VHANLTHEAGKDALQHWLSGQFKALQEGHIGPEDLSINVPIKVDQAIHDLLTAYGKQNQTKLRIWNAVLREVESSSVLLSIIAARFQSHSPANWNTTEPGCLSIFGMKATTTGILSHGPMLVRSRDSAGMCHKILCQKRDDNFADYRRSAHVKKSRRGLQQEKMVAGNKYDDWEVVWSQAGAITGFHVGGFTSGRFLRVISGVKVLCACPCSANNWEVFKQNYRNMHELLE